jgi:hypothetical protein
VLDLNPTTHAKTLELLSVALLALSHVNQVAKHAFGCPRPVAYSPTIQPVINPRRFGAFPSGHAAEAFMVARLLQLLSGQPKRISKAGEESILERSLQRIAERIATNRVIAGVHFHVDSLVGRMVGETFAEYIFHRACRTRRGGKLVPRGWNPRGFDGNKTLDKLGRPLPNLVEIAFNRFMNIDEPTKDTPFILNLPTVTDGEVSRYCWTPLKDRDLTPLEHAWHTAAAEWYSK